jgi:hypothetical protein
MSVSTTASDRLSAVATLEFRRPEGGLSISAARRGDKLPGVEVIIEMQPRSFYCNALSAQAVPVARKSYQMTHRYRVDGERPE